MSSALPADFNWDLIRPKDRYWRPRERDAKSAHWECGDSKQNKKVVRNYLKAAGFHGLTHICPSKKLANCLKLIFRLMFCGCLVLMAGNISFIMQDWWSAESSYVRRVSKPTETGRGKDPEYFPSYPRVTICRRPTYTTDMDEQSLELVEYGLLALGFPFVTFQPEDKAMLVEVVAHGHEEEFAIDHPAAEAFRVKLDELRAQYYQNRNATGLDARDFVLRHGVSCPDVFLKCQVMPASFNCCERFKPILTSMGTCFTLSSLPEMVLMQSTSLLDFPLVVDLAFPTTATNRTMETGFYVFLTDPLDETPWFNQRESQPVLPGIAITISVQLLKEDRTALHTAWHGMSEKCPSIDPLGTRFTRKACHNLFISRLLTDSCHCISILKRDKLHNERYCDPIDLYNCMMKSTILSNLSNMTKICEDPCMLYEFRTTATYGKLGSDDISRVEILYNSKQFILHEHCTNTISSLLGRLGGVLGLYLGASIITVVEFLVFVLTWNWYTFMPSKVYN